MGDKFHEIFGVNLCHFWRKITQNELFRPEIIGKSLKMSILLLMNKIKDKINSPKLAHICNIYSFYKGKHSRQDLNNERGIFIMSILRTIKEKLIYKDIKLKSYTENNLFY